MNEELKTLFEGRDFEKDPLQVLSCGAGEQSTAMLQMIVNGDLDRPDIVIFSDTGSEMPYTYEIIKNIIEALCNSIDLPFYIVRPHEGKLHEHYREKNMIPMVGMRSCTSKFKIRPQRRFVREIVGNKNGVLLANAWLGITTDEAGRMATSDVKWMSVSFPLIEKGISRSDCREYNIKHNLNVAKSGCYCCPYQSDNEWIRLLENYPDLFNESLEMEKAYFANRDRWKGLSRQSNSLKELLEKYKGGEIEFDDSEGSCSAGWNCFL